LIEFAVIASFVGSKALVVALQTWLVKLQATMNGPVVLGQNLSRVFFMFKATTTDTICALLLFTSYHTHLDLSIFQRWVAGFDPDTERGGAGNKIGNMSGMNIPTWLTLRNLKGELRGVAKQIAANLGEFLGEDQSNLDSNNLRFCVGLQSGLGWEPSVVVCNEHTNQNITVLIDYYFLSIRGKYCHSVEYCLKDRLSRPGPYPQHRRTRDSQSYLPSKRADRSL
jgi:hypothetical protein